MSVQTAKERVVAAADQDYVVIQAEALLKSIVQQVDAHSSIAPLRVFRRTPEIVEEVIFEANIDGTSYYVIRSQAQQTGQVSLSPRELGIARLIAKGMPNKCIGDILEISQWTVATYLRRIFVKLGVTSRAAMVARLGEENLL